MVWAQNQQVLLLGSGRTTKRWRLACVAAFAFWCFLMFLTPKISPSHHLHTFADMRNFFGVPNTLNVMTNFPFLVVGVLGFVLCLQGGFFNISFPGEVLGWVLFYAGTICMAFGSAYYHLKPDDTRIIWDYLPMMVAYPSLLSTLIIERMGQRVGLSCLFALLLGAFSSIAYERTFNDLRLCMTFQLIPCIAIPVMAIMIPPKYTYSSYWIWAAGFHLLANFEALADMKIYSANRYILSGHSLEHLCSAMAPLLLFYMLIYRDIRFQRLGDFKGRP